MSDKAKKPKQANLPEISEEGIKNLAGYFDVLIQMDFAIKLRNERSKKDENRRVSTATTNTDSTTIQKSAIGKDKERDDKSTSGKSQGAKR